VRTLSLRRLRVEAKVALSLVQFIPCDRGPSIACGYLPGSRRVRSSARHGRTGAVSSVTYSVYPVPCLGTAPRKFPALAIRRSKSRGMLELGTGGRRATARGGWGRRKPASLGATFYIHHHSPVYGSTKGHHRVCPTRMRRFRSPIPFLSAPSRLSC
jgi:hypothetical protein